MPRCYKCGKKSFFLRLAQNGLCKNCVAIKEKEALERTLHIAYLREQELKRKNEELKHFREHIFPISSSVEKIQQLWEYWEIYHNHNDYEQINRQKRALYQTMPILVDSKTLDGLFISSYISQIYNTDLTSCDCGDFEVREKPCKHMYRLFHELTNNGKINQQIVDVPYSTSNMFYCLNENNRVDFIKMIRYMSGEGRVVRRNDMISAAIETGLFLDTTDTDLDLDYTSLLQEMTKDGIMLALTKKSIVGFRPSWSKVKLIDWVIETQMTFLQKRFDYYMFIKIAPSVQEWVKGIQKSMESYEIVIPKELDLNIF